MGSPTSKSKSYYTKSKQNNSPEPLSLLFPEIYHTNDPNIDKQAFISFAVFFPNRTRFGPLKYWNAFPHFLFATVSKARIAIPDKGACDWGLPAPMVASCLTCNRYFDSRDGYGDNTDGHCEYVPDHKKCFPAAWARQHGFTTSTQCHQA